MSQYDPTDIHRQERAQADRAARGKLARDSEADDLKWLMGSKRGRRIVWRLLEQAGVFRLSFHTDAMQMAFNEGNRNYGNRVLTLIHAHCPERYPTMIKEQTDERHPDD